ncbi:hypothetical protein ACFOSS_02255 [Pseudaeromonas sharmana]|uniref:YcxB-like protein domain-containing protein n=1 Tax=Pseudaeromonas sharmana TaxID=328412 RepID=A0ABV8CK51_9GAMM
MHNIIKYEITKHDLIDFHLYYAKNSKAIKNQIRGAQITLLVMFAVSIVCFCIIFDGLPRVFSIAFVLLFGFVQIITYEYRQNKKIIRYVNKLVASNTSKHFLGRKSLTINTDSIIFTDENTELKFSITPDVTLKESEKSYFIFRSETPAVILPKKFISNESGTEELLNNLNKKSPGK